MRLLAIAAVLPWCSARQAPLRTEMDAGPSSGSSGSSPERRAEMAALLDKYAPVFKLASTERYYPSSVQYMLDRYTYVEDEYGIITRPDRRILSLDRLQELPHTGADLFLSLSEMHNGQPLMPPESEFLYGPAGQTGALEIGPDGRGRVHDEVYGFWVDQGRGVVDLWYWTFYPYNLGKEVGMLGILGNHVTDWEHLRVRTVNGTAQSADFNTHSGGAFSAGTYLWTDIERTDDNRPIAYVASGSHGVWPTPGRHVYAQLLNLWALADIADDRGALWDTQGHVVPIEYWTGPDDATRIVHDGDQGWLEFVGKFGNREPETCWWHVFVGICQVIDGPPGPNRAFGSPPDCIIGESSETSSYSFYLTRDVVRQAQALGVETIVVEQVCARPGATEADADTDTDTHTLISPEIAFSADPLTHYHVDAPPCGGSRTAAKAYRLSLLDAERERISTSPLRTLCIYSPGTPSWVAAAAADIRDVDEWRWNLKG